MPGVTSIDGIVQKVGKLIPRVERLERKIGAAPTTGATDGLWEIDVEGGVNAVEPAASAGITGLVLNLTSGDGDYATYFNIAPGINSSGSDVRASSTSPGHGNEMDLYFWARHSSGASYEAGRFFDAIGDDGSGRHPESYSENYATGDNADWFVFVDLDNGASIVLGLFTDDNNAVYLDFESTGGSYLKFRKQGTGPWPVAPDAALGEGDWSFGVSGIDFVYKINDAGTIKTATLTPA